MKRKKLFKWIGGVVLGVALLVVVGGLVFVPLAKEPGYQFVTAWGEKDFVFDRSFLERWNRYLPNAETHVFGEAGHYVLEDAKDRIIPLVKRFLRDHPLNGGPP